MNQKHNQDKFHAFRNQFQSFTYESYTIQQTQGYLKFSYVFSLDKNIQFRPSLDFPIRDFYSINNIEGNGLELLAFNLGMAEMISYWKATCSPRIIIKAQHLDDWQKEWWKKLFYKGLGEFFHTNGINPEYKELLSFEIESDIKLPQLKNTLTNGTLLPIGGGKDSIVSLELLKESTSAIFPTAINPSPVHEKILEIAGYDKNNLIEIQRKIDPQLIKLNAEGYLNGHTPFSAIVAFASSFMALLSGQKNIALSNESSANEPTIPSSGVNHQYSKSIEFESDFRNYSQKYIHKDLNYFSFLRPLNELQIGKLFSKFTPYHKDFRSCNVGSKKGIWCCNCPKCLFTYIILSPFISDQEMKSIFGQPMFENQALLKTFDQLNGKEDEKPFECVGTIDEVNAAIGKVISETKDKLPYLLQQYQSENPKQNILLTDFDNLLNAYDPDNFLSPEIENLLMEKIRWTE
jgi:UDP-N-acetyl-alpha-D-muramoyl-L-alanyl-L-glutamate epimerase